MLNKMPFKGAKRFKLVTRPRGVISAAALAHKKEQRLRDYSDSSSSSDDTSGSEEGKRGYKKGGYHPVTIGDVFNSRYTVIKKLGWGAFSTVWLCNDKENPTIPVALKIIKSSSRYTESAEDEIKILKEVSRVDPMNVYPVVHYYDHFFHHGPHGKHACLVFEALGSNLCDLVRLHDHKGIPLIAVKFICKQILEGLDFLHTKCKIIHTDLKPENILLHQRLEMSMRRRHERTSKDVKEKSVQDDGEKDDEDEEKEEITEVKDKIEQSTPCFKGLTKNQKKRLKKKLKASQSTTKTQPDLPTHHHHHKPVQDVEEISTQIQSEPIHLSTDLPLGIDVRSMDDPFNNEQVKEWLTSNYKVKIMDLGNGCWTYKHFSSEIQTRQYRAPEVILGCKYCTPSDIWSVACTAFELATGELLFDPRNGKNYDKNDDHMALMIRMLGHLPRSLLERGKYSREMFTRKGALKTKEYNSKPLAVRLTDEYKFSQEDAEEFANFLRPMLRYLPEKRATASEMLSHPWLTGKSIEEVDESVTSDSIIKFVI